MTRAKVNDMIRVTETYDTLHANFMIAAGGAEILFNLPNTRMWQIIVQNDPDNQNPVFVGNADVQSFQLVAGASITLPIDRTNKVFINATAGDRINWLAMG